MQTNPLQVIESIEHMCWDCELAWLATSHNQTFLALEPESPGDQNVAHLFGFTLTKHQAHPELSWIEIARNLDEQS